MIVIRELTFNIEGQKLESIDSLKGIHKGTKQYIKCKFITKDPDWVRKNIAAVFVVRDKTITTPVTNNTCMIPDEVSDYKSIKLWLTMTSGNVTIVTNKILIEQEE